MREGYFLTGKIETMNREKTVDCILSDLKEISTDLKNLRIQELKRLDKMDENQTRSEYRAQLSDTVYLTNANAHIKAAINFLKDIHKVLEVEQ